MFYLLWASFQASRHMKPTIIGGNSREEWGHEQERKICCFLLPSSLYTSWSWLKNIKCISTTESLYSLFLWNSLLPDLLPSPSSLSIFIILSSEIATLVLVVKNLPANAGDIREGGLIPGMGRSPGGGHGKPLQYSCLENPMDRAAWQAAAHEVAKSQT